MELLFNHSTKIFFKRDQSPTFRAIAGAGFAALLAALGFSSSG
jgi:hypothetical protein